MIEPKRFSEKEERLVCYPPWASIPIEVIANPTLTNIEKILFGYIFCFPNRSKGCMSSNSNLAKALCSDEKTIKLSIKKLKNQFYFRVKTQHLPQRKILINSYYTKIYKPLVDDYLDNLNSENILKDLSLTVKTILENENNGK